MRVLQAVLAAVVVALFGASVGVMSMTPPEYAMAKGGLVGAAVALTTLTVLWASTSNESVILRVVLSLIAGGVVFGLTPLGIRFINDREHAAEAIGAFPNLSFLSKAELQQTTARLVIRIHDFEKKFWLPYLEITETPRRYPRDKLTDAERQEKWRRDTAVEIQRANQLNAEYQRQLFSDVLALDAELRERIKNVPTTVPSQGHIAALSGTLAGANPLAELVTYFEVLASKIPDAPHSDH